MDKYERGDTVRIEVTFINADGELTDPSLPKYSVTKPDGASFETGDLDRVSVGLYRADVQSDTDADLGYWIVKVWGNYSVAAGTRRILDSTKFLMVDVIR